MKRNSGTLMMIALVLFGARAWSQQDSAAYRAASSVQNAAERMKALEKFMQEYPDSKLKARAFDALFDLYVDGGREQDAVQAAHQYLQTIPPESRMSPYNRFAYALAQKNIGLDSALAFIDRAMAMAGTTRSLSGFQDTKAYILWRQGRFDEAERLQRTAIVGHEDDPEYLEHLALIEKDNGKPREALTTLAKALYLEASPESKQLFTDWMRMVERDKGKRDALKESVVMATVHSFTDTLKGAALIAQRSAAAAFMADLGVRPFTARAWAQAAVTSLTKKSSINDVVPYKQNLAVVLFAEGKHKDALRYLRSIEELVDPYNQRYWNILGRTYERLQQPREAMHAYMNGLIARNDKQLRSSLEALYAKEHGSLAGLEAELDSSKAASSTVHPGKYEHETTPGGKVILAELFTGAECGPCVSSDLAFDALSEYYPRTALAIIEYHVHIPGPDPLTTNESWDRYKWYDGQGTPTAVFEGKELIIGGGSKTVTRNRYGVYRYAIRKFEADPPRVGLSVIVKREGDEVRVTVQVSRRPSTPKEGKPVVHIALVEKSVDYTGANGISEHKFVVRRMADGAVGFALSREQETITKSINLGDVERNIKEFLDNPTSQPSWSNRRPFNGWRARPERLNRSNLAVVVWVQDVDTKEVLQAVFQDVPESLGIK